MTSPIPSFDSSRLLARFLRYAGNRHQVFRPRLHRFACELLSRFQEGVSEPISYEALRSLQQCNRLHKITENLYLSDGVSPGSSSAPESVGAPSNFRPRQVVLLNFESRANPHYHSLPVGEVLCLFRHKGLFKECRSAVFRQFRLIHASQMNAAELLASSGNLIVCLAQVGAALFPGKPGARMALRLIRRYQAGLAISKGNLLLVQQILQLQAKSSHFTQLTSVTENILNQVLSSIYPSPPSSPPTQYTPDHYFKQLPQIQAYILKSNLTNHGYGQQIVSGNNRTVVRQICQDSKVDPLAAYVVAMAWGGQDFQRKKHFQKTLNHQPTIRTLLGQLRVSGNSRDVDFNLVQVAAKSIEGLGISFYTKLLYFFRPTPDAYILDKWTAMASFLLFVPQPIRLGLPDRKSGHCAPSINTTAQEYEEFCAEIDMLPGFLWPGLSIPGDVAEMAMFGVPPIPRDNSKKWRKYINSNCLCPSPPQPKSKGTPKAPSNAFLDELDKAHMASDQKLPAPMGLISKPALVTPWSPGGVRWVYDPAGMHVRVFKHYKSGTGLQTYQKELSQTTTLQNLAQANGWVFTTIKGASPGLGFKILGNTTSIRGSRQIIVECVQAMQILFAAIP